ncbi:MAG: N-acetylneuraminate synthase family protein [Spirochaetes bacterium]|nr:N-acetylneuraminate synthase family protein [Spirochaetota bacterium]
MSVIVIAEIGINHNGDLDTAKKLIDGAAMAGCDAVKFQKRTLDVVYTKAELDKPRESPWGTTNREQKAGLEFSVDQYKVIDAYCKSKGIDWLFSAWDIESQRVMRPFNCKYNKVASAMLGNVEFLKEVAGEKKYTFVSTGMSTVAELDAVVDLFKKSGCPFELMHCNSTYPMKNEEANLSVMATLRERYKCKVGYSGHETGRIVSFAAVALGATSLERHITLDKTMYGSDQAASIEIDDLIRLVRELRMIPGILGSPEKTIYPKEAESRKKLRYYDAAK